MLNSVNKSFRELSVHCNFQFSKSNVKTGRKQYKIQQALSNKSCIHLHIRYS